MYTTAAFRLCHCIYFRERIFDTWVSSPSQDSLSLQTTGDTPSEIHPIQVIHDGCDMDWNLEDLVSPTCLGLRPLF